MGSVHVGLVATKVKMERPVPNVRVLLFSRVAMDLD